MSKKPEDIYKSLVIHRNTGSTLVLDTEKKVKAQYLHQIRDEFQNNEKIKKLLLQSPSDLRDQLIESLEHLIRPDTQDIFELALDQIIIELAKQLEAGHGLYLVDDDSGEIMMPLTPDMIYQPPDYEGEDGKMHKAMPIVHPKITSSLALLKGQKHKEAELLDKYKDTVALKALEHLKSPEKIIDLTIEKLKKFNITIVGHITSGELHIIEFGHEQADGVYQSFNPAFQRISMFSSVLATKIYKLCGNGGICSIKNFEEKKNSKQHWYKVDVAIHMPKQLH
jgi:hypothetical protein